MSPDANSAGAPELAQYHLVRSVPVARRTATCGGILNLLQEQRFEYTNVVAIVDDAGCLSGIASVGEIVSSDVDTPVAACMHTVEAATLDMDQERVASLAIRNPLGTGPVVDEKRQLIGLIPPEATLAILRHEHVEDLHRLTGILRENEIARAAIEGPPVRRVRHRLPWLLVGLAGSAFAAVLMSQFHALMESRLAVIYFLPGIVYLADAIGTQTEAIAVRGLSLSHVEIRGLIARELWTGLLIGAILGGAAGGATWAFIHDVRLALAVGTALFAAAGVAATIGLLLPWTFQRLGFDPAYGSGPLATVIQDILSLLVYFACVLIFAV